MPPKKVDEKLDCCRSEDETGIKLDVKKGLSKGSNRMLD